MEFWVAQLYAKILKYNRPLKMLRAEYGPRYIAYIHDIEGWYGNIAKECRFIKIQDFINTQQTYLEYLDRKNGKLGSSSLYSDTKISDAIRRPGRIL